LETLRSIKHYVSDYEIFKEKAEVCIKVVLKPYDELE